MTAQPLPGLEQQPPRKRPRVTAKPQDVDCPICGATTIAAWRDGVMEDVHTDPVALTALGELQALADGRRTFSHWAEGLALRGPWIIARRPAGTGDPIRPEHRCGSPPTRIDHHPPPPRVDTDPDAPPPF